MMAFGKVARSVPCILLALAQLILAACLPTVWPIVHLHTATIDTRTHPQWWVPVVKTKAMHLSKVFPYTVQLLA